MPGRLIDFGDIYRILINKKDEVDTPLDVNNYFQSLYVMCARTAPVMRNNQEILLRGIPFGRGLRSFVYTVVGDSITLLTDALRLMPEEQMMQILEWLLDFILSQLDIPMPEPPFRVPVVPQLGPVTPLI
ncbi:hypothetical protein ES703_118621 [subsurface metagenome]